MKKQIRKSGFTLIELLISLTLACLILSGLYFGFQTGIAALKKSEEMMSVSRDQSVFFLQLNQELRNAIAFSKFPFTGDKNKLTFPARLTKYSPKGLEDGVFLIEYACSNGVLSRKETKLRGGDIRDARRQPEILFEKASSCGFDYLTYSEDGKIVWDSSWSNLPYVGLPRGVRVLIREQEHKILIPQGVLSKYL